MAWTNRGRSDIVRSTVASYVADSAPPRWPHAEGDAAVLVAQAARAGLLAVCLVQLRRNEQPVPHSAAVLEQNSAFIRLAMAADLLAVSTCLDAAGLRWLLVKGPVLDEIVYRQPHLRTYADLDVIVHPGDFRAGLDALIAAGATPIDRNWSRIATTMQSEISLRLPHGTVLDLHWHVVSDRSVRDELRLDIRELFAGATRVHLHDGLEVPAPAPVDHLVYVALHAVLSGGHQLRWLVDVAETIRWAAPSASELRERGHALSADVAMDVMAMRVRRAFGHSAAPLAAVGRSPGWLVVCRTTDSFTAPEVAPGGAGLSGRAVFSSTRTSWSGSVRPLARNTTRALTHRQNRANPIDRSVLHLPGGTDDDRAVWLRHIEQYA